MEARPTEVTAAWGVGGAEAGEVRGELAGGGAARPGGEDAGDAAVERGTRRRVLESTGARRLEQQEARGAGSGAACGREERVHGKEKEKGKKKKRKGGDKGGTLKKGKGHF